MKVALLCSGMGNVLRGHETFARQLFDLVSPVVDMTLFKGGGTPMEKEVIIDHIPRDSQYLRGIHLPVSPKWLESARDQERIRIEGETFAYGALKYLLMGEYNVIHCLEQEVCNIIFDNRHLFPQTPKVVFSNGGAIPRKRLPRCDFVQEHSPHNLSQSDKTKAFLIPHGVDTSLFSPDVSTNYRSEHGIPEDAFLVISVGTICHWHKRMDHVIREVAQVPDAWLLIVGQDNHDTPDIKRLGKELLGNRIVFDKLSHEDLPKAYAAADVFALGSLFETFGIVYIEAMAMGLPVVSTNHLNQREIIKEGIFIDMEKAGALANVLRKDNRIELLKKGESGRRVAVEHYDLSRLRDAYLAKYTEIGNSPGSLPRHGISRKIAANLKNVVRRFN